MKKLIALGLICIFVLIGCGEDGLFGDCDNCNDEITKAISSRDDFADCSSTEWSDGTWCTSCWWWELGVENTFCQWDSCGCDVSTYTFTPIHSMSVNEAEESTTSYISYQDEDIEIRFSHERQYHDGGVIPFAVSKHLTEDPVVSMMTNGGLFDCHVEYTNHDESGISTGLIYVPYEGVSMIYFNDIEIPYDL